MTLVDYRVALANLGGSVIEDDVFGAAGVPEGAELVWYDAIDDDGSCEFTLPIDHSFVSRSNFMPGAREIYVYRNEDLVWGGKLWIADVDGWEVRFMCKGWKFDLDYKIIDADYASTKHEPKTDAQIVTDMINNFAGDLGITVSGSATGAERRLIICVEEQRTVRSVIDDLAEAGFEYVITADKTLVMAAPAFSGSGPTLTGGGNISDFAYQEDASDIVTRLGAVGPHEECAIPLLYQATAGTGTYGIRDGVAELPSNRNTEDEVDMDFLEAVAEAQIGERSVPVFQPTVSAHSELQQFSPGGLSPDNVALGDVCTVSTSRGPSGGFGHLNMPFRVIGRRTRATTPGYETFELELDSTVD